MKATKKLCLSCKKPLQGRTDKKFCDHYCRNAHNNQQNSDRSSYMRNINNILRKNRRLLEQETGRSSHIKKVSREALLQAGFSFRYYTHQQQDAVGQTCFFDYEYGYRLTEDGDWVWVWKQKSRTAHL